jgi:serine/threonine-protein kinase/endoribonuclease IRE1
MLAFKPARRMSIVTLLFHPVFWKDNFKLKFISDISDRLEKLSFEDALVQRLELGAGQVVRGDWRRHICDPLQKDLRRFRNYRGNSVRDLLRAIRNKKNHYRELPEDVKASLGTVPDAFMQYFSSRFPSLLMHSYITFKGCCSEQVFQPYYADDTEYS